MAKAKTTKVHRNDRRKHRIKRRILFMSLVAISVFVLGGISWHRCYQVAMEFLLVVPVDKVCDYLVFGGD